MINIGELQMINIVEPQLERGDTQFSEEIETANPRPDDRNCLRASLRHDVPSFSSWKEVTLLTTARQSRFILSKISWGFIVGA